MSTVVFVGMQNIAIFI